MRLIEIGGCVKVWMCGMIVAGISVSGYGQQVTNPVVSSAQEIFAKQSQYMIDAAAQMPAEKYGYHPTPDQWTYGKIVSHVVVANNHVCAMFTDGVTAPTTAVKDSSSKEELAGALKASFAFCGKALDGLQDARLGDTITYFGGVKKPRARALVELTDDLEDHYSQMASYLRMNGMVPPSAKKK